MIDISLTKEDAIALLLLIDREQSIYTTDPTCTPASVVRLRAILNELDTKLDTLVAQEQETTLEEGV